MPTLLGADEQSTPAMASKWSSMVGGSRRVGMKRSSTIDNATGAANFHHSDSSMQLQLQLQLQPSVQEKSSNYPSASWTGELSAELSANAKRKRKLNANLKHNCSVDSARMPISSASCSTGQRPIVAKFADATVELANVSHQQAQLHSQQHRALTSVQLGAKSAAHEHQTNLSKHLFHYHHSYFYRRQQRH